MLIIRGLWRWALEAPGGVGLRVGRCLPLRDSQEVGRMREVKRHSYRSRIRARPWMGQDARVMHRGFNGKRLLIHRKPVRWTTSSPQTGRGITSDGSRMAAWVKALCYSLRDSLCLSVLNIWPKARYPIESILTMTYATPCGHPFLKEGAEGGLFL